MTGASAQPQNHECRIGVDTNEVSPPPAVGLGNRAAHATTTRDLPADVLILIFWQVYYDSRVSYSSSLLRRIWLQSGLKPATFSSSGPPSHWYETEDPFQPTLFPEALASVCTAWKEAMTHVSLFWTRLVILIGDKPTPLSTIRSYLALSKEHPLDVIIGRRPGKIIDQDLEEATRVDAVMKLLYPHSHRWRLLHIDTLHEASLPQFHTGVEIDGPCSCLVNLRMLPRITDAVPALQIAHAASAINAPVLRELEITGLLFRQLFAHSPTPPVALLELTILGYRSDLPGLPVRELALFLTALRDLTALSLSDLQLDCTHLGPTIPNTRTSPIEAMYITDMHGDAISRLYQLLDFPFSPHCFYERCTVPMPIALAPVVELTLTEIKDAESLFSLMLGGDNDVLECLYIERSAGLDDHIFDQLAEENPVGEWFCSNVRILQIADCHAFSFAALKRMIEARRTAHALIQFGNDFDPGFVVTSIQSLTVIGCGELPPEDRTWLNTHVGYVTWGSWFGGYKHECHIKA